MGTLLTNLPAEECETKITERGFSAFIDINAHWVRANARYEANGDNAWYRQAASYDIARNEYEIPR
jgi:hypothetical protein